MSVLDYTKHTGHLNGQDQRLGSEASEQFWNWMTWPDLFAEYARPRDQETMNNLL